MNITKKEFIALLEELFEVPASSAGGTDLSDYIKDSIDVGELLSALKIRHQIVLEPNAFRKVRTIDEVWALIEVAK
jgi:acyl carrier protein